MHRLLPLLALTVGLLLAGAAPVGAGGIQAPASEASGGFAGPVDIGNGRHLYLECHGRGSPTVVLEAGYGNSGAIWSEDSQPGTPRMLVFPGVAAFTHVCVYDRPGTGLVPDSGERPTQSDPVAQPRSATDVVADLHALLHVAGVPTPYVLAGHSLGGVLVRLYASTYPDDVAGIVLIDARPDGLFAQLEPLLTPHQWGALMWMLQAQPDPDPVHRYGLEDYDVITLDTELSQAAATTPMQPMPLAVLAQGQSWGVPEAISGFPPESLDSAWRVAQEQLAALVPNARLFVALESGHFIQLDQPALVIEAIREVVAGLRNRDTWYDLSACCTP